MVTEHQREIFAARVAQYDTEYQETWWLLENLLTHHSAEQAVVPHMGEDPHLALLVLQGKMWTEPARLMLGEPISCHSNVARLFEKGEIETICTGYALSDDGLWRQHSWGLLDGDVVVETTQTRVSYFGIRLPPDEADDFVFWNQ